MTDGEGRAAEQRHQPEHPRFGGKRWYDMPRLPAKTILVWLTIGGMIISGVGRGFDWLASRFNAGPAAEIASIRADMRYLREADSLGRIERANLMRQQAAQAQALDTVKQGIAIFAEQLCDRDRRRLTLGVRTRCNVLFPTERE